MQRMDDYLFHIYHAYDDVLLPYSAVTISDNDPQHLFQLIRLNDYEGVKKKLQNGTKMNIEGPEGLTPLHMAAMSDRTVKCLTQILKAVDVDINARSVFGLTALAHGLLNGSRAAVKLLIDHGANINIICSNQVTLLHLACFSGVISNVKLLVRLGANVNARDLTNWTPLHEAAQFGHIEICKFLLNHGAIADVQNTRGEFPLDIACNQAFWKLFNILSKKMSPEALLEYSQNKRSKTQAQNGIKHN